jgi:hypothetical protein
MSGDKAMIKNMENRNPRHGNPWRTAVWSAAAILLLLPLAAMQFTEEVDWGLADFMIFGAMLFAACGTYELAARVTGSRAYRAAVGVAVAAAFLLIWINLAVGIIGTEDDPSNLMFGGVIAIGIIGALIARFRPLGVTRALVATAIAQALVAVIGLFAGWSKETVVLPIFFTALWLASAWLFRTAARKKLPAA